MHADDFPATRNRVFSVSDITSGSQRINRSMIP